MAKSEIQNVNETTDLARVDPDSPAGIMMQLMSNGGAEKFDVEGFGKMLEYQERHDANQARKAYHVAMAEFQAESPKIIKQKSGHNNKYAGLSDIVAVIAPLESKHGLSHSWVTGTADKEISVICKITHILGHSEQTELSAGPDTTGSKNDIQALGSTITYLQRYTLKAALGLAEADQDDDGNGTGGKPAQVQPPNKQEQKIIDLVCQKLDTTAPQGMRVDVKKVTAIMWELTTGYPTRESSVDKWAKWFGDSGRQEIFIPDNRSDFEKEQGMPGDEDSATETPEETTAREKFGEEVVPCRFLCNACSHEYDEFIKIDQCPKCLTKDVLDRQNP
jgi:hypothetical protein